MKQNILTPNIDFKQDAEMYKNMYLTLFNRTTDAITALSENGDIAKALHILKQAQGECEEIYVTGVID